MKWYKRDPDRALNGMAVLTLQQRGAYNSILDLLYSRDGVLPDDDAKVARMIRCHGNEWKAVKAQLVDHKKIWVEDGLLKAIGVEKAIKEATNFSQTQSKRVGKRWEKYESAKENNEPPIRPGNTNTTTPTTTEVDKRVRATRWHPDAAITQDWLDHALMARRRNMLPDIDLLLEAEKFANHWSSASGARASKLDWHKTWINWALKAEGARHGKQKTPSAHDKFFAAGLSLIVNNGAGSADGRADQGEQDDGPDEPSSPLLPP